MLFDTELISHQLWVRVFPCEYGARKKNPEICEVFVAWMEKRKTTWTTHIVLNTRALMHIAYIFMRMDAMDHTNPISWNKSNLIRVTNNNDHFFTPAPPPPPPPPLFVLFPLMFHFHFHSLFGVVRAAFFFILFQTNVLLHSR